MNRTLSLLLCCAPLTACGYSSIGGGTDTIEVIASVIYRANSDQSDAIVEIWDGNNPPGAITDAVIRIADGDDDTKTLPVQLSSDDTYHGTAPGFFRHLTIEINRGPDRVAGRVETPAAHTVSRPKNSATRKISKDLPVVWATGDGLRADQVVIELSQARFATILIDDSGTYTIPNVFLRVGADSLAVRRQNAIVLAGGIRASSLTGGYQVNTDLTILGE